MNPNERLFTIGRSRSCDIVLSDDTVSRRHAELTFMADGKLLMTDCHSSRGTFLVNPKGDKQRIRQELVTPIDTLQFGDSVCLTVKEILEAIRLKFPAFEAGGRRGQTPEPRPEPKPWVNDKQLVRCECGAVKPKTGNCPECGRS